jgi:hypothetical protein
LLDHIIKKYRKNKNWIPHAMRHFLGSSRSFCCFKIIKTKTKLNSLPEGGAAMLAQFRDRGAMHRRRRFPGRDTTRGGKEVGRNVERKHRVYKQPDPRENRETTRWNWRQRSKKGKSSARARREKKTVLVTMPPKHRCGCLSRFIYLFIKSLRSAYGRDYPCAVCAGE